MQRRAFLAALFAAPAAKPAVEKTDVVTLGPHYYTPVPVTRFDEPLKIRHIRWYDVQSNLWIQRVDVMSGLRLQKNVSRAELATTYS